jgi:hypothetical protein
MSARRTLKNLKDLPSIVKLAAGVVAAMVIFAACSSGPDGVDQSSARSTDSLPDWTNDPTKYHPK